MSSVDRKESTPKDEVCNADLPCAIGSITVGVLVVDISMSEVGKFCLSLSSVELIRFTFSGISCFTIGGVFSVVLCSAGVTVVTALEVGTKALFDARPLSAGGADFKIVDVADIKGLLVVAKFSAING